MSGTRLSAEGQQGSRRAWSLLRFIVITGLFVGPVFWWLDEATTMVGMPIFRAIPMGNETVRVEQPQGGASKADKDSSNVTMHPVQVRQSSHQDLDNPSKSPNDFAKDLAQLRLALQRERDATEKLVAGLAGDLLQIQQERDKTAKVLAEPIKQVAQLRQALQN